MGEYLDARLHSLRSEAETELNKDPVYFEWVLRLLLQGEQQAALGIIHEAERLCSLSAALCLREAERSILADNLQQAIANLAIACEPFFSASELQLQVAIGLSVDHELEKATQLCHDLLVRHPEVSQALLLLSRINQEYGNLCKSVAYALRYLLLEPEDVEAFSVVAALLMELGEERTAMRIAVGGLMRDPDDECCNVTACMLGIVQGQYIFAGRRLHRILKKYPESGRAWLALTYKEMFIGSWQSALGSAVKATLYLPEERISWACLGWCQLLTGDLIGAAHSYGELLNLEPQDSEARGALALIALLSGKLEEAEKWIRDAQHSNPISASAQVVGLLTLLSSGNPESAYRRFELLAKKGAKSFLEMLTMLSFDQKKSGKVAVH